MFFTSRNMFSLLIIIVISAYVLLFMSFFYFSNSRNDDQTRPVSQDRPTQLRAVTYPNVVQGQKQPNVVNQNGKAAAVDDDDDGDNDNDKDVKIPKNNNQNWNGDHWDHDDFDGDHRQDNWRQKSYNEEHPIDWNVPRHHVMTSTIERVRSVFFPILPIDGMTYFGIKPRRAVVIHSYTQNCDLMNRVLFAFTKHPKANTYDIFVALYGNTTNECTYHLSAIYAQYIRGTIPEPPQLSRADVEDSRNRMTFYQYVMNDVFVNKGYDIAIVLEEKTIPSDDLVDYSIQTETLLYFDPSLFCISYFNDNGYSEYVYDTTQLYRSGLFPTYGFMINRKIWGKINGYWPTDGGSGWDHFIRTYVKEYDLECIIPEYSRVQLIKPKDETSNYNDSPLEWFQGKSGTNFGELSYLLQSNYELVLQDLFRITPIAPVKDIDIIGFDWSNKTYFMENSTTIYSFTQQSAVGASTVSNLLSSPKGYHRGTIIVPYPPNGLVIFADKSQSIYLPKELRIGSTNDIVYLKADTNVDCNTVCQRYGWFYNYECVDDYLSLANKCEVMKQYFPCENGCVMELGDDVPSYVVLHGNNYHKCVTTESTTYSCSGQHERTQRLCTCTVKPSE